MCNIEIIWYWNSFFTFPTNYLLFILFHSHSPLNLFYYLNTLARVCQVLNYNKYVIFLTQEYNKYVIIHLTRALSNGQINRRRLKSPTGFKKSCVKV